MRCCDTVTALCRFTAHGDFMPSSSFRTTSDGTPRIVEVTGATVTVDRYAMACCQHRHSTSLRSAGRTSASVPTLAEVAGFAEGQLNLGARVGAVQETAMESASAIVE